jgi:hypothetical protein
MTGTDRDSAMLRLTLARLLAAQGETQQARAHLEAAVAMDPGYTAAWKELGKLCLAAAAAEAWRRGIERARENGDKQAEREMTVFLRRLG